MIVSAQYRQLKKFCSYEIIKSEKIVIDEEESTVFLEEKGMKLDFGGIARDMPPTWFWIT